MDTSADATTIHGGQNVIAVLGELRAAILQGEIAAGAVTSQTLLAQQFQVGRTPLREALRMLQREGLIISEPNHRLRIAELTSQDAEELYIMRISLEAVAIRITVPALTSNNLAELEGFMAQMDHYERRGDNLGHRGPHRAFHHLLIATAGARVSNEIGRLFDHAERYRLRFGPVGSSQERRAEHRAILDAAGAGDADLAAEHLTAHYLHTAALVFSVLNPDHDLARLRTAVRILAPGAEPSLDRFTSDGAGV